MSCNYEPRVDAAPKVPIVRLLFSVLWNELRSVLGSAPTAAILRRAIALTSDACPGLGGITITRDDQGYRYDVPLDLDSDPRVSESIGQFVENVLALLSELTGTVLTRHLLANPLIRRLSNPG